MVSRKKPVIAALTICVITITLFFQVGVFANQTTAGDFTVEAEAYDVFYDCNRDGKVDMIDIFGCILRYGTEGAPVRISYISIPPAAFNPFTNTQSYYMSPDSGFFGDGNFYTVVQLPHGANVTKMTVTLVDEKNDGLVQVMLFRSTYPGSADEMATIQTGGPATPGIVEMVDNTINNPIVNNSIHTYQLLLHLTYNSPPELGLMEVVIEYEYTP